ncbi:hypothetical protein GCM10009804_02940 [Kribbella hippodromi]|uniref:Uncharacterized protein n=1 Tax=Kribbella hippodromi TaxID=434347 RepID=A0ABP4MSV4_9ACTN
MGWVGGAAGLVRVGGRPAVGLVVGAWNVVVGAGVGETAPARTRRPDPGWDRGGGLAVWFGWLGWFGLVGRSGLVGWFGWAVGRLGGWELFGNGLFGKFVDLGWGMGQNNFRKQNRT